MKLRNFLVVLWPLVLLGCAPAVAPTLQQQAGAKVSFAELTAHPDNYKGRLVILGGEVMTIQPHGSGSLMSVNQEGLDANFFPKAGASGGTFVVASDEWLSPAKYQPKSKVSVAGVVEGRNQGLLLLKARQIHLWEGPAWEKWYYPVPRDWYDPGMEYWYTPPYFDPWRGGRGGR